MGFRSPTPRGKRIWNFARRRSVTGDVLPRTLCRMSLSTDRPGSSEATLRGANVGEIYDANGVDRTLVRWMLRQSPAQRLAYAQGVIDLAESARRSRNGHR